MSARSEINFGTGEFNLETDEASYEECMQMAQLFLIAAGDTDDMAIKACHRELALTWLDAAHKKRMH